MTTSEKLTVLKTMLDITDTSLDVELTAYLDFAKREILCWVYGDYAPTEVPIRYENTQIMAVVTGYNHKGSEGQITHNENGINRTFNYADMVEYIRKNAFQVVVRK